MKFLSTKLATGALTAALASGSIAPVMLGTAHAENLVQESRDRDAARPAAQQQGETPHAARPSRRASMARRLGR